MSGKPTKTEKCKDGLEAKRVNAEPLHPQRDVHAADAITTLRAEHVGRSKDIDLCERKYKKSLKPPTAISSMVMSIVTDKTKLKICLSRAFPTMPIPISAGPPESITLEQILKRWKMGLIQTRFTSTHKCKKTCPPKSMGKLFPLRKSHPIGKLAGATMHYKKQLNGDDKREMMYHAEQYYH